MRAEQGPTDLLFVYPDSQSNLDRPFSVSHHLGAAYIVGYLRKRGIRAEQFTQKTPVSLNELAELILMAGSRVVGFTCYDASYYYIRLLARLLKTASPQLVILLGGPTATFSSDLVLRETPEIDVCVRGEGEETTYDLMRLLATRRNLPGVLDLRNVNGISYRHHDRIENTPDRPLICGDRKHAELDVLPSPYLDNVFVVDDDFTNEDIWVTTARGCIYRCTYCNFSAMSRWTIRYHSVERVVAELKSINDWFRRWGIEAGDRYVQIADDTFSLDVRRAKAICRGIIREDLKLTLAVMTRADKADAELLSLMYQAGFRHVNFGLESAVPDVLRTIKKLRDTGGDKSVRIEQRYLERVRANVAMAKELGLTVSVGVIMGLPGSSLEHDKTTLEFVRELRVDSYSHNYLNILPGTELFDTDTHGMQVVSQPHTVLPYRTRHAYNVRELPELENSTTTTRHRRRVDRLMSLISGDYGDHHNDGYPDVLLPDTFDDGVAEWLRSIIAVAPFIGVLPADRILVRHCLEQLLQLGVPTQSLFGFTPTDSRQRIPGLARRAFPFRGYRVVSATNEMLADLGGGFTKVDEIQFLPLSNYQRAHETIDATTRNGKGRLVFMLSTSDDVSTLLALGRGGNEIVLEGAFAKKDCCLENACCWSERECPARRLRRLRVHPDGSLAACLHGDPIARVGEARDSISESVQREFEAAKRERRCDACSVRDSCAKCMYPYPLDSRAYCELMTAEHTSVKGIRNLFGVLEAIRRLKAFAIDVYEGGLAAGIEASIRDDRMTLALGGRRIVYDKRSNAVYAERPV